MWLAAPGGYCDRFERWIVHRAVRPQFVFVESFVLVEDWAAVVARELTEMIVVIQRAGLLWKELRLDDLSLMMMMMLMLLMRC